MNYVTKTDDGLEWSVNPITGEGRRLTAVPKGRATRKPPQLTRQFPPLTDTAQERFKSRLSAIASNPLLSSALVWLLASNATDRPSAMNVTGRRYKLTEIERDLIVSAFLELRR